MLPIRNVYKPLFFLNIIMVLSSAKRDQKFSANVKHKNGKNKLRGEKLKLEMGCETCKRL